MASIYRRGKIWWVTFHLKGARIQQSLNTTHERVAQARKSQIEYRLATGTLVMPSETPIGDFLEGFCQYLRGTRTRKSYKNDISYLRIFFGPICRSLEPGNTCNRRKVLHKEHPKVQEPCKSQHVRVGLLEELSSEMISQFITRRIQTDGISARTANRFREVLHRMFAYAIKETGYAVPDGAGSNPVADVGRRQEPAPNIRFLRLPEVQKQLRVLRDSPTLQALVATLIYAGLRREEALWLTVDDVDLEKRLIYVRAKSVNEEHWQPKTKRNRVVSISRCTRFSRLTRRHDQNPGSFRPRAADAGTRTISHRTCGKSTGHTIYIGRAWISATRSALIWPRRASRCTRSPSSWATRRRSVAGTTRRWYPRRCTTWWNSGGIARRRRTGPKSS